LAAEALASSEPLEDPMVRGTSLTAAALVHAHTGPVELARELAGQAITILQGLQWGSGLIWPCWALGVAELADGNPEQAVAMLMPLAEQLEAVGGCDPALGCFVPDAAEALIALGDLDRAEHLLDWFALLAHQHRRSWAIAGAARARGALESARGDAPGASAAFELALGEYVRAQMPFERARTQLLAGQAHRRFKQRARARDSLAGAADVFAALGAKPWQARAEEELARVGTRGASSDQLTPGERRIAELVSAGLSNREVADRAFVSVKTVEAALTRVYRKLGVRSRVGLTRALGQRERVP
jgi:DNA-binding CsgD family transcriptional regulator